jgi:hypothetical protein
MKSVKKLLRAIGQQDTAIVKSAQHQNLSEEFSMIER